MEHKKQITDIEMQRIERLMPSVVETVRQAGEIMKSADIHAEAISHKEGIANFVTAYDVHVQELLVEKLKKLLPEACFFGEEEHLNQSTQAHDGYLFIIDPIDGTTNFIFDYHHSCISVGLAFAGQMVMGVVCNPYTDDMYAAVKGAGAQLNGRKLIMVDRALSEGIAAFGCARYNTEDTDAIFGIAKKLYLNSLSIREGGSAALDLSGIAAGRNVFYIELLLQPYDYAASSLIITEAGGVITQVSGEPITFDKPCSIMAGTKRAWEDGRKLT